LLRFWLLKVDAICPADRLAWFRSCLGHVFGSPPSPNGENKYNTFQASAWPCACASIVDDGGIIQRSQCFQYGIPTGVGDVPMTGIPRAVTCCDDLLEELGANLLNKIGRTKGEAKKTLPTYVFAHENPGSDSPLFNAMAGESVMFCFNISCDGVFCVKPAMGKEFADSVIGTPADEKGWLLPVFAAENSMIVMGGYFLEQMTCCLPSRNHCRELELDALGQRVPRQVRDLV